MDRQSLVMPSLLALALATALIPAHAVFAAPVSASIVSGASALADNAFNPNPLEINIGDTVTWTNNDSALHTVTSGNAISGPDGTFNSSFLAPHATYSFTFNSEGEFSYYCQLHPAMVGLVDVKSNPTPPENSSPAASNDFSSTDPAVPVTINVLSNDNDPDGDALSVVSVTDAANGGAVINGNGTITYTPGAGFTGTDSFQYTISDGKDQATATVTVTVNANTPPTPPTHAQFQKGDVFIGAGNGKVFWFLPNGTLVKPLDTHTNTPVMTGMAFHNITFNGVLYPNALFSTTWADNRVFIFSNNGTLLGPFGSGYNSRPEAVVFDKDGKAYFSEVFGTGDILKFDLNGTLIDRYDTTRSDWIDLSTDQCTMLYTQEGTLVKRFNVCEGEQMSDFSNSLRSAYALRILPNGNVLVANGLNIVMLNSAGSIIRTYDSTSPAENSWFALNLDPDGKSFWSGGLTSKNVYKFDIATGEILASFNTGAPGPQMAGVAIFGEQTVAQNEPPIANDDSVTTMQDTPVTINLLANDTDLNKGDTLSLNMPSSPANGSLHNNGDGTVTYTPISGFTGEDTFQYSVFDGIADSNPATVTITVSPATPSNLPPQAVNDTASTRPNTNTTIAVLSNDSDPNGDPLTVKSTTDPANGLAVINPDYTITYTPNSGFIGHDSFTYTISDSKNATATATVSVSISNATTNLLLVNAISLNGTVLHKWAVISDDGNNNATTGQLLRTGFTPMNFTGDAGKTYSVNVSDFGSYAFDHWSDNNSITRPRLVTLPSGSNNNTTIDLTAIYKVVAKPTGGPATLNVNALSTNSSDQSPLNMFVTVRSNNGTLVKTGYTPFAFTGSLDADYKVTVANYDGKMFVKWQDDGSTNRSRMINLTSNMTLIAIYDTGKSLRGFSPLTYTGTDEQPDLTVNALSTADNSTIHAWMIINPISANSTSGTTTYQVYAASGYRDLTFDHWSDNGSTDRVRSLTIDEATTITAYYSKVGAAPNKVEFLYKDCGLSSAGCGVGTLTNPDGTTTGPGPISYAFGLTVSKPDASPASGSWSAVIPGAAGPSGFSGALNTLVFNGASFTTTGDYHEAVPSGPPAGDVQATFSGQCGGTEIKFEATNGFKGTIEGTVKCTTV